MGLWPFIARRLVLSLLVLLIVSVCTFTLAHAVPGSPLNAVIGERQADRPEVRERLEQRYGLDKPLPVQYFYYLKNLMQGDFGTTIGARSAANSATSKTASTSNGFITIRKASSP